MTALGSLRVRIAEMARCREVGRLLQSHLDGELDEARAAKVSAHLEHCLRCGMKLESYAQIKVALARVGEDGGTHPEDRLAVGRLRRFADALATGESERDA